MKLSVVTDELSADFETALELARDLDLRYVEIRGIGTARFPFVSEYWQARVPQLLTEFDLQVAALSAGLFKVPWPVDPPAHSRVFRWEDVAHFERHQTQLDTVRDHVEHRLPAVIAAATALGVETIVAFSFDRGPGVPPGPPPNGVVEVLRAAGERVADAGLQLAIEVEHICWGDTGARTAELVEAVDHPAVGINWDPANSYRAGDDRPYPDGYAPVRPHVRHVHFKDASTDDEGNRRFGVEGLIDWAGQLAALAEDGYDGFVSVETHARPKIAETRRALERLRGLIGDLDG